MASHQDTNVNSYFRRVRDLVTCLPGRTYMIYTGSYYTSVPLCKALMDREMSRIGTLRKDRGVSIQYHQRLPHLAPEERLKENKYVIDYNKSQVSN